MHVVTVEFVVKPGREDDFRARMLGQARDSREQESDCLVFDVCSDPRHPGRIFLYEVYRDAAAFERHLASPHFHAFDAAVADWVVSKRVARFQRLD